MISFIVSSVKTISLPCKEYQRYAFPETIIYAHAHVRVHAHLSDRGRYDEHDARVVEDFGGRLWENDIYISPKREYNHKGGRCHAMPVLEHLSSGFSVY